MHVVLAPTYCYRKSSVRLSVCPSVRLSVTLMHRERMCWVSSKIVTRIISLGSSLLGGGRWICRTGKWRTKKFQGWKMQDWKMRCTFVRHFPVLHFPVLQIQSPPSEPQRRRSSPRSIPPKFGWNTIRVGSLFSAENLQYLGNGAS